jgi:hypothetical protein
VLAMHHALSDATAIAAVLSSVFIRKALAEANVSIEATVTDTARGDVRESVGSWLRSTAQIWRRKWPRGREWRAFVARERVEVHEYLKDRRRWPLSEHAPERRSALFRIRLPAWRAAAEARNGGVNELYLAVAAATQRRYLDAIGAGRAKPTLRVIMPVSLRGAETTQELGSVTGAGTLTLRGSDDELADLSAIRRSSKSARRDAEWSERTLIGDILAVLPSRIQATATLRRFALTDVMATNLVVPLQCEVADVPVGMVFMVPPVIGTPVSFGLTGYGDWLHCVVTVDDGLVADPERLVGIADDVISDVVGKANMERLGR